jgi:SAM-dependent methyltransferase
MYDPMTDPRLEDIQSYKGRLTEFLEMDGISNFNKMSVLVPGSALGGECFATIELVAQEVTGMEVINELVLESEKYASSKNLTNVNFLKFDGRKFPRRGYDVVLSGHVIEHSPDWREHLSECIKSTRPNGKIYLEFPSRYHYKELHTGLVSFEWLPPFIRLCMNLSSAKCYALFGRQDKANARYSIQNTLQQISEREIRKFIRKMENELTITSRSEPSPGIIRLIFQ